MKPLILRSELIPEAAVTPAERAAEHLDQAVVLGLVLVVLFGALALGAVQNWSMFGLRTASLLLFMTWAIGQALKGSVQIRPAAVFPPAAAFYGLAILQFSLGLTANRHDTLTELQNYTAYGVLAFLAVQTVVASKRAEFFSVSLGVVGFALAVFAIVQDFTFNGKLFWILALPKGAVPFGPYINHNHYAGLMELLLPFPLVEALDKSTTGARAVIAGVFVVVMTASVGLSLSRGGILAVAVEFGVMLILSKTKRRAGSAKVFFALLVAVGLLLVWIGNTNLVPRLATLGEPARADVAGWRLRVVQDSLAMVRERPLLGWGLGTFPTAYPRFRTFYVNAFVNQAHNDYAQLLVETGFVGFGISIWFLWSLLHAAWQQLSSSGAHWRSMLTAASLLGVTGILVHSMSDFNLHIPVNAALFFMLCALATSRRSKAVLST